jgi:hypothetical protein
MAGISSLSYAFPISNGHRDRQRPIFSGANWRSGAQIVSSDACVFANLRALTNQHICVFNHSLAAQAPVQHWHLWNHTGCVQQLGRREDGGHVRLLACVLIGDA